MKKLKLKKIYNVDVYYPGYLYPQLDAVVTRKLGREHGGSGMGFGLRDLGFEYKTFPAAVNALQKLKSLPKLDHVSFRMEWVYD